MILDFSWSVGCWSACWSSWWVVCCSCIIYIYNIDVANRKTTKETNESKSN